MGLDSLNKGPGFRGRKGQCSSPRAWERDHDLVCAVQGRGRQRHVTAHYRSALPGGALSCVLAEAQSEDKFFACIFSDEEALS